MSVCMFSVLGEAKEIDWFAPNGEKLLPGRTDISISQSDDSISTLTIYNANVDNAGMYKCVAKSGEKESQATVVVKIFRKFYFVICYIFCCNVFKIS